MQTLCDLTGTATQIANLAAAGNAGGETFEHSPVEGLVLELARHPGASRLRGHAGRRRRNP